MTKTFTALRIVQNGRMMYLLSMAGGDLLTLTKVDEWNADLTTQDENYADKQGYQRAVMPRHYAKISSYLNKADSLLPTSVLLSSRSELKFTPKNGEMGELLVDSPLWVVDGQHRIAGLRHAIEQRGRKDLETFQLPVCLMSNLDKFTEINQFYTVNSTAKGVQAQLAGRLLLEMEQLRTNSAKASLSPSRRWELRAIELTILMNQTPDSPWFQMIQKPNSKQSGTIISERSFSTSLRPILNDGTMAGLSDAVLVKWLTAFWQVVKQLMPAAFDDPREYAIQKTPGVYSLHMIVPQLFGLWVRGGQGIDKIKGILTANHEISQYFTREEFWKSGSGEGAQTTGMAGFTRLANDIADALPATTDLTISI